MAVEYINRKGQKYYLHEGKTKTGKPKYFFSMKKDGDLIDFIPEEYEIYENPNAQVFLRKIPLKVFTDQEIKIVEEGVKKFAKLDNFIVDVKKNNIIVYLPDQNVGDLAELFSAFPFGDRSNASQLFLQSLTYSPMMQFVLEDAEIRKFVVERWCFRGSVDDWIPLDSSTDLKKLVKKYCRHLGKESFYELMPMYF
ncbi:MAG: hypothetical protein AB4426_33420 [Xenococcaceae cyanobacterium]